MKSANQSVCAQRKLARYRNEAPGGRMFSLKIIVGQATPVPLP